MMYALFIEETKRVLNTQKTFSAIADEFGCSCGTLSNRFYNTIDRLVWYFDFDNMKIEYPCVDVSNNESHRRDPRDKFYNARRHADFWLQVISDYENGVQRHKYTVPVAIQDGRKISDLTVSEFKQLFRSCLDR